MGRAGDGRHRSGVESGAEFLRSAPFKTLAAAGAGMAQAPVGRAGGGRCLSGTGPAAAEVFGGSGRLDTASYPVGIGRQTRRDRRPVSRSDREGW